MMGGGLRRGGGHSSTHELDVDVVGRKEGRTMDFRAGKFRSQHDHMMSEFQRTQMINCRSQLAYASTSVLRTIHTFVTTIYINVSRTQCLQDYYFAACVCH